MGVNYRIIPENEMPYEWARAEQKRYYPNPKIFELSHLSLIEFDKNALVSIFPGVKPENPTILLVYWTDVNRFKYSYLSNYNELKEKYPEEMEVLERNGIHAYRQRVHEVETEGRLTGKRVYDPCLCRLQKEEEV